jgi:TatD DNase family protein
MSEQFFDNHCHVHTVDDPDAALDRARDQGVVGFVNVGCDAEDSRRAIALAERHDDVWATVGLHPHEARHGVDTIRPLFGHPKVVAVGECGLDYFYDHSPRDVQRVAFAEQIALAHQLNLPLVIHTRDAWADTFDVLAAEGVPTNTIFHCFTGGPEEARRCLDLGAYLSFSGIVTFKTATDNQAAARLCPIERLLAETDTPFLAPIPHRGRRNEPAWVRHVCEKLAEIRQEPLEHVARATRTNAVVAFGIAAQ